MKVVILLVFVVVIVLFGWMFWRDNLNRQNVMSNISTVPMGPAGSVLSHDNKGIWVSVMPPKPTLKQLLCQIDAKACKMKLRYTIHQQWYEGQYIWVGYAWPNQIENWDDAWRRVPIYDANGGSTNYETKEKAASALLDLLNDGAPNQIPDLPRIEAREAGPPHPPEPRIDGPLNCDPHRQCQ